MKLVVKERPQQSMCYYLDKVLAIAFTTFHAPLSPSSPGGFQDQMESRHS